MRQLPQGPADIVTMNGAMHHLGDAGLAVTLGHVKATLKPYAFAIGVARA